MSNTELEQDNIISALKGDDIIRSCVSCEHYQSHWASDDTCRRQLKLKYHPITGKKELMGDVNTCLSERCLGNRISRPEEPCGPDGRHWKERERVEWFSWLTKAR